MSLVNTRRLRQIAEIEFADIVNGRESHISEEPERALRDFLEFVRRKIQR